MKQNKKNLCRQALIEDILTLRCEPGSVLDETELSARFGLSRTPLREVFHGLAGEGYLRLEKNRGAKVSSMDLASMRNFFATAPMVYAAVARMAAEAASRTQINALKQIQSEFRKCAQSQDPLSMAMQNHLFHQSIGTMADNPYLTPSLNRLLIDHTRMSQMFYQARTAGDQGRIETACDQHDQMIEAIEAREPARIVELTLDHWALSKDQIDKFVRPDPLPIDVGEPVKEAS